MLVLLIVIAILLAIGFLPVGATALFDADGPRVYAQAGPIKIKVFPLHSKNVKKKKEKKPKEKKEKKQPEPGEKKEFLGGKLPMFRELIALALELQADFRDTLHLRTFELCLYVGGMGSDPAKSALLYGNAWAAIGNLMPRLHQVFRIDSQEVRAEIHFLSEETTVYAKATAVITVGAVLRIAVYYGIRGFRIFWKHRKKGGKKHGTSNHRFNGNHPG